MWFHAPNKACTIYDHRFTPVIFIVFLLIAKATNNMGRSIISEITTDMKSVGTESTSGTSSLSSSSTRKKWNSRRATPTNVETFRGANPDLSNKVFVIGGTQASKYDDAYKAIITYLVTKFDHRVSRAFEMKDANAGLSMLIKPSAPMKDKVIQVATEGDDSILKGEVKSVVDKDGEEFIMYQIQLKQYLADASKYNENLERCFGIIMGQCSPSMEQSLMANENFVELKSKSDSIGLIKLIEAICYSYQSHEYPPLGAWQSMDVLARAHQPDNVSEANHYEKFKTIVEVCKANGVNFSVLCSANVDMAIKALYADGKISINGTYKKGTYFALTSNERAMVDEMSEEICLSTRFLSLASNKLHAQSKQELKNDLVKGDDKYPRTIASTITFLQYHSLRNNNNYQGDKRKEHYSEAAFAQDADKNDPPVVKRVSRTCRAFEEGTCEWKTKHTWKECPSNKWGINTGKTVDSNGALIMCTVDEFSKALEFDDNDLVNDE